jgi:hypothetical protein
MKIDQNSVYVGMGVVGAVAGGLGLWRRRLPRIFAACIAAFILFELFCLVVSPPFLGGVWWAVHTPSAMALGVDEIVERHGAVLSTAFHLGDFFLWSAAITGIFWFRDRKRGHEMVA